VAGLVPPEFQRRLRHAVGRRLTAGQRHRLKRAVAGLRALRPGDLDALARYYGTDKGSQTVGIAVGHNYTPTYQRHFAARRKTVRSVLEIGVGGTSSVEGYDTRAGGQSLRMWRRYFPHATILGIDIHDKAISAPRIHFERGDGTDPAFLKRVISRYGPFDIVIDDGSHIGREIIASFGVLWEAVKPGGFYVIEDLPLAYHPDWEGGPPGTPDTAADLLKRLIDSTLLRAGDSFRPSVAAMYVYPEIVFLQRSLSTDSDPL
jgi:hypothetical protein